MSFQQLPEELVDLIAFQLRDLRYKSGAPCRKLRSAKKSDSSLALAAVDSDHEDDLPNFCLVSRQIVNSGRRALYFDPFDLSSLFYGIRWTNARNLLLSLQADQGKLGRLVRRTTGLYKSIWSWMEDDGVLVEEVEEGCTFASIERWFLDILRICPSLIKADVLAMSERTLQLSLSAITPSLSTLQQIKLRGEGPRIDSDPSLSRSTMFQILRVHLSRPLPFASFDWIHFEENCPETDSELPIQVRSLKINLFVGDSAVRWLPPTPTAVPLEKLKVRVGAQPLPSTFPFETIAQRVGASLKVLQVLHFPGRMDGLSSYGRSSEGPSLAPNQLAGFPHLQKLKLHHFHGPSLEFLKNLVTHAPLLRSIEFEGSLWVSNSDPSSTIPDEVFPEHKVVEQLTKFKHLQSIQLGILPTTGPLRYDWIRTELEKIGIQSSYEVCEY